MNFVEDLRLFSARCNIYLSRLCYDVSVHLGFLVEDGRGMEKLVIVAISLNLLTESLGGDGLETVMTVCYMLTYIGFFNLMQYI